MKELTPQHLYSDTPPTILRNRKEKERKAKDNPFWIWFANYVFSKMLRARFYSIMYKNAQNYEKRDKTKATIFYTNHNNWWDGIVGYNAIHFILKQKKFRLMIEEMNRFPLFQYIGCFPINKKTPQDAIRALKYATTMLETPETNFWLFPQGIIRPPHYRPEVFQAGISYMTENAVKKYGGVNLCPVAINYTFLRQDKPEVIMEFGEVKTFNEFKYDRKEFCYMLERDFENLCDQQQAQISSGNFEGYKYCFRQKLSWWRDIERHLKNVGMKKDDKI